MKKNDLLYFCFLLIMLCIPGIARGQTGDFTVTDGTLNTDYSFSDNVLTFTKNGSYTVTTYGKETTDHIVIADNFEGTITLKDVNIGREAANYSAIDLKKNVILTLMLEGENNLFPGSSGCGIHTNQPSSSLVIDSKINGLLYVDGTGIYAAIGGAPNESAYNITIKGGTIYVHNGSIGSDGTAAAAIGGGSNGDADNILISGGTVTAFRNFQFAPIIGGGNKGQATNIQVTGGSLKLIGDAEKFGTTPKNVGNYDVYELKCIEAENAISVKVDNIDYPISGNHVDDCLHLDPDPSLYFWLTGKEYTIKITTTSGEKTYNATWNDTNKNFTVKGENKWLESLTIAENFEYGTTITPSAKSAFGTVTYLYSTEESGTYTDDLPSDIGKYYVKAKVEEKSDGNETYEGLESDPTLFNIVKVELTADMFDFFAPNSGSSDNPVYDGNKKEAIVKAKDSYQGVGTITPVYYKADKTELLSEAPTDAGTYNVKITVAEGKNYKAVNNAIGLGSWTFTIDKATPTYTTPTDLKATYGQKLKDVVLPDGWTWDKLETSVGDATMHANVFPATFTPDDTKNYTEVKDNLSITVSKVTPTADNFTFTAPASSGSIIYDGEAKEATVAVKDGLAIGAITVKYYRDNTITKASPSDDPTEAPVNGGLYTVKIDVAESNNNKAVTDITDPSWTFTIDKASLQASDFKFTPPTNLVYDGQFKVATIKTARTLAGLKQIIPYYYDSNGGSGMEPPQNVGTFTVKAVIDGGINYISTSDLTDPTWTFTITPADPPVNPPVEPDPPVIPDNPDPAPVHYTITLPTVEGVATDPAAGSYKVESGDSFSFLLTLDESYQKDSHPVVTAHGETLTPNASTGKYIIRNVRSDIMVEISGIVKDIATGNESLSDGFRITTSGGLLLVTVPRATRLYLTDTSGRLILSRLLPAGDTRIDELAAGVYLLTLEGEGTKKILLR